MFKKYFVLALVFCANNSCAQPGEIEVSMASDQWTSAKNEVEFASYKGVPAMKLLSGDELMILNEVDFSNGTIEFDVEMTNSGFSMYFRRDNPKEAERVYLRTFRLGNPEAPDVIQYAPVTNGVLLWDLLGHYQGPAEHLVGEWNHVKMVVSGERMRFYINDMDTPVLDIAELAGNSTRGALAFEGAVTYANLVVKPGRVEGLSSKAVEDPTSSDARYLRQWEVSEPVELPYGSELASSRRNGVAGPLLPGPDNSWESIDAERLGLVNLSRRFGESVERRGVWLKTMLITEEPQARELNLGFSDEVWVLLNGQLVYVDKNTYNNPIMKEPGGRISIENARLSLPLRRGENELLVGVSNDFWGWGVVARLDEVEGITILRETN